MTGWRELSDDDLFKLDQEVNRRLGVLQSQGVMFQGIDVHYVQCLLESQMSERELAKAREMHLLWMKASLDDAEKKIRAAKLTQGVAGFNGSGGHG